MLFNKWFHKEQKLPPFLKGVPEGRGIFLKIFLTSRTASFKKEETYQNFTLSKPKKDEKMIENIHKNWTEIYIIHCNNCTTFLSASKCNIFQDVAKISEHRNPMR